VRADIDRMRTARLHVPHVLHHLIWRFVDRGWYFTNTDERRRYLWWLGRALEPSDWQCIAYAMMSNHIHLAVVAGAEPLADWSRRAHAPFARWMNERHGRLGGLFADRARDYALAPETTRELVAYIHNNPVRGGVVKNAAESDWTSHRAYLGLSAIPAWLDTELGLARCGFDSPRAFSNYVDGLPSHEIGPDVTRIASAVKRHGAIHTATPHGRVVPLVARPFARVRPNPLRLVELTCELLDVPAGAVRSRRRHPRLIEARSLIVHAGRALGLVGSDIAAALGVSKQAVSKIAIGKHPHELRDEVCRRIANEIFAATNIRS
jgi:putative transposase